MDYRNYPAEPRIDIYIYTQESNWCLGFMCHLFLLEAVSSCSLVSAVVTRVVSSRVDDSFGVQFCWEIVDVDDKEDPSQGTVLWNTNVWFSEGTIFVVYSYLL